MPAQSAAAEPGPTSVQAVPRGRHTVVDDTSAGWAAVSVVAVSSCMIWRWVAGSNCPVIWGGNVIRNALRMEAGYACPRFDIRHLYLLWIA